MAAQRKAWLEVLRSKGVSLLWLDEHAQPPAEWRATHGGAAYALAPTHGARTAALAERLLGSRGCGADDGGGGGAVTWEWVQESLHHDRPQLLTKHTLFRPFARGFPISGFEGDKIAFSNYNVSSTKRRLGPTLLGYLGAKYHSSLKNTTTVLITKEVSGDKCERAKALGTPMLTIEWLYESMRQGRKLETTHAAYAAPWPAEASRSAPACAAAARGVGSTPAPVGTPAPLALATPAAVRTEPVADGPPEPRAATPAGGASSFDVPPPSRSSGLVATILRPPAARLSIGNSIGKSGGGRSSSGGRPSSGGSRSGRLAMSAGGGEPLAVDAKKGRGGSRPSCTPGKHVQSRCFPLTHSPIFSPQVTPPCDTPFAPHLTGVSCVWSSPLARLVVNGGTPIAGRQRSDELPPPPPHSTATHDCRASAGADAQDDSLEPPPAHGCLARHAAAEGRPSERRAAMPPRSGTVAGAEELLRQLEEVDDDLMGCTAVPLGHGSSRHQSRGASPSDREPRAAPRVRRAELANEHYQSGGVTTDLESDLPEYSQQVRYVDLKQERAKEEIRSRMLAEAVEVDTSKLGRGDSSQVIAANDLSEMDEIRRVSRAARLERSASETASRAAAAALALESEAPAEGGGMFSCLASGAQRGAPSPVISATIAFVGEPHEVAPLESAAASCGLIVARWRDERGCRVPLPAECSHVVFAAEGSLRLDLKALATIAAGLRPLRPSFIAHLQAGGALHGERQHLWKANELKAANEGEAHASASEARQLISTAARRAGVGSTAFEGWRVVLDASIGSASFQGAPEGGSLEGAEGGDGAPVAARGGDKAEETAAIQALARRLLAEEATLTTRDGWEALLRSGGARIVTRAAHPPPTHAVCASAAHVAQLDRVERKVPWHTASQVLEALLSATMQLPPPSEIRHMTIVDAVPRAKRENVADTFEGGGEGSPQVHAAAPAAAEGRRAAVEADASNGKRRTRHSAAAYAGGSPAHGTKRLRGQRA